MGYSIRSDLRNALRQIATRPGLSMTALVILALGIGANTAIYTIVNNLLLRPLPYPDSERIVSVGQSPVGRSGPAMLSNTELWRLWEDAESFEEVAAYTPPAVVWSGASGSLFATAMTPSLFPLLRTTPHLGRLFIPGDAVAGAQPVALLSEEAWTRRFASNPDIVGTSLELNGEPYTVIGVLPHSFDFPHQEVDLWTPLNVPPYEAPVEGGMVVLGTFLGIGRLRAGVTPGQAATEVRTIFGRVGPEPPRPPELEFEIQVIPLRVARGRPYEAALQMLAAATVVVLLIACANIAGLLLAGGIVRQRELAIRGAVGARRVQLIRQLLTESVVLSIAGGVGGLVVAVGIAHAAPAWVPGGIRGASEFELDGGLLLFAVALSVVVGLLFGVAPALAGSRFDPAGTLYEGSVFLAGSRAGVGSKQLQAMLVVVQVALAFALLIGAALLLRSFVAQATMDFGLDPADVLTANIQHPVRTGRVGPEELDAIRGRTTSLLLRMEHIASLSGVNAVALSSHPPLVPSGKIRTIGVVGQVAESSQRSQLRAGIRRVTAGYADVVRLRLRAGRFFTDRDTAGSRLVAVVSDSFAREAFGGAPAVGQLLQPVSPLQGTNAEDDVWEVIGVVADVDLTLLYSEASPDEIYLSLLQPSLERVPEFNLPIVGIRTTSEPVAVTPFLRELLADVTPGAPVDVMTLDSILATRVAGPRLYAVCATSFGVVALLLAGLGLYGVLSYSVSQRQQEFGVRMALGARRGDILALVMGQGFVLVGAGLAVGVFVSSVATRVVEGAVFRVGGADPLTFTVVVIVLVIVSLVACWIPARRATQIDPMDAVRKA